MGNTVAEGSNGILRKTTIAVEFKYLRLPEMLLINCKVELKLTWTKYCVLLANGNDNHDAICNNIILTTKGSKLYVPILTLSAKGNQKLTIIMGKGLERSVYQNEYTTKIANNNRTNKYRFFSNQSLKEVTHCLFQFVQMKIIIQKGIKTNNIIFQNALLKIITSSQIEKTFMRNSLILI